MDNWSWADYLKRRRAFIEARRGRASIPGVALVFAATFLTGWACNWALLRWLHVFSMPLRYAIGSAAAYAVFFPAVRVWADFQRLPPKARSDDAADWTNVVDIPGVDAEGCLIVLAPLLAGMLAAFALYLFGGFALLLEIAFEVVFAGVVVRSAVLREFVVGRWWQVLLRRTALPALLMTVALAGMAAWVQQHVPQAHTLGQAYHAWVSKK